MAVASPDSASDRIAALASWWLPLIAFLLALAIRPFRESWWTAAPALLSVIPWLPIPMSPVFLIWTGPLAWAPIILALALAVGLGPVRWLFRRLNLFEPGDATVAALVLAVLIGGLSATATSLVPGRTPGGDEPAYLMIATSLLKDGDLDLQNNHDQRDYATFYAGELPRPDLRVRGLHGEGYSIHAPGVAVVVAPLFQLFGYTGARMMIVLLTSIGAMLIWRLSWRATDSAQAAWFAWAAVVLSPTFAFQSFAVFPDGPGLMAVSAGALLLVQLARGDRPGVLPVMLTGVALASLPWLHTRFALLAGGLGALISLRMLALDATVTERVSRLVALLLLPIVSALLWFYSFNVMYGTFNPSFPYGPEQRVFAWIVPAILGLFFDGQFGLAAFAPAVAAFFVGLLWKPLTTSRRLVMEIALIVFLYLAAITTVRMWWAGVPATPARFMMAVLPLLAVPIAIAWTRVSNATRALFAGLAGCGAIVTALLLVAKGAEMGWAYRNDAPAWLEWLSPVANLSRVWPGFFWDEARFPWHVLAVVAIAVLLWALINRRGLKPRVAATLWAIALFVVMPPISWAVTGARPLDPARAQFNVVRSAAGGGGVFAIGAGRATRLRTFASHMTIRPVEPGVKDWAVQTLWFDVPRGRYVIRARSMSSFPTTLKLLIARSGPPWREFTIPAAGEYSFPFLLPSNVSSIRIDAGAPRPGLSIELAVDAAQFR